MPNLDLDADAAMVTAILIVTACAWMFLIGLASDYVRLALAKRSPSWMCVGRAKIQIGVHPATGVVKLVIVNGDGRQAGFCMRPSFARHLAVKLNSAALQSELEKSDLGEVAQ